MSSSSSDPVAPLVDWWRRARTDLSSSSVRVRADSGTHVFRVGSYSSTVSPGECIESVVRAGGRRWRLLYYPNGATAKEHGKVCVELKLEPSNFFFRMGHCRAEYRVRTSVRILTAASIAGCVLLVFMLLLLVIRSKRNRWRGVPSLNGNQGSGAGIIAFRYADLVHATKNFSDKLGGGGFGSVFNGTLADRTAIAVKRLDGARQGEKQFRAEVSSLGLIQHINLVKLIGFCCEGGKRLLVYERMSNRSLDTHLFDKHGNTTVLSWTTRYQVALGVARGLSYLHQSCRECIIHCDIKPENILLDASFAPKIADFGMAAIVGRDFSRVLTTFRGTVGYLAPEWLSGVAITPKVDVYSFGMVLLEIMSGRRNTLEVNSSTNYHVAYFPVQAISKLHEGDIQSLVDPQLQGDFDLEVAERVCRVAFWCIQDDECDRPTMGEVVQALEGLQELDTPPMPRLLAAITKRIDAASM